MSKSQKWIIGIGLFIGYIGIIAASFIFQIDLLSPMFAIAALVEFLLILFLLSEKPLKRWDEWKNFKARVAEILPPLPRETFYVGKESPYRKGDIYGVPCFNVMGHLGLHPWGFRWKGFYYEKWTVTGFKKSDPTKLSSAYPLEPVFSREKCVLPSSCHAPRLYIVR